VRSPRDTGAAIGAARLVMPGRQKLGRMWCDQTAHCLRAPPGDGGLRLGIGPGDFDGCERRAAGGTLRSNASEREPHDQARPDRQARSRETWITVPAEVSDVLGRRGWGSLGV
jgi:hypothetical protein